MAVLLPCYNLISKKYAKHIKWRIVCCVPINDIIIDTWPFYSIDMASQSIYYFNNIDISILKHHGPNHYIPVSDGCI